MIDRGLVLSILFMAAAPLLLARRWPPRTVGRARLLDTVTPAAVAGIAAARLAAVALDDPGTLGRPRDLLLIRGGMEFWAGAAAGLLVMAAGALREGRPPAHRLADVAPFALWAYALYQAACLFRDGCFGPTSALGIRPPGLAARQFPVELAVAAAAVALGFAVRRLAEGDTSAAVALALAGLAAVRLLSSLWLPRVGTGVGRLQWESLAVAAVAGAAAFAGRLRAARRQRASAGAPRPDRAADVGNDSL